MARYFIVPSSLNENGDIVYDFEYTMNFSRCLATVVNNEDVTILVYYADPTNDIRDSWTEITEERYNEIINEVDPPNPDPEPDPEPTPDEVRDQAILDTAVDMEYLLCLEELGLLVITE